MKHHRWKIKLKYSHSLIVEAGDATQAIQKARELTANRQACELTEEPGVTIDPAPPLNPRPDEKSVKILWQGKLTCDLCGQSVQQGCDWFADANVPRLGGWALCCQHCATSYDVKFGTGKGQKFNAQTREKIEG